MTTQPVQLEYEDFVLNQDENGDITITNPSQFGMFDLTIDISSYGVSVNINDAITNYGEVDRLREALDAALDAAFYFERELQELSEQ